MAANYSGWTGAVMDANHQRLDWCRSDLIYRDWTGAAMAANYRGLAGAARNVAGNYYRWLGSAMAANYRDWCGDYCKLYCCSDGCKLQQLDRCGA